VERFACRVESRALGRALALILGAAAGTLMASCGGRLLVAGRGSLARRLERQPDLEWRCPDGTGRRYPSGWVGRDDLRRERRTRRPGVRRICRQFVPGSTRGLMRGAAVCRRGRTVARFAVLRSHGREGRQRQRVFLARVQRRPWLGMEWHDVRPHRGLLMPRQRLRQPSSGPERLPRCVCPLLLTAGRPRAACRDEN
jgi:hypothetical protein